MSDTKDDIFRFGDNKLRVESTKFGPRVVIEYPLMWETEEKSITVTPEAALWLADRLREAVKSHYEQQATKA